MSKEVVLEQDIHQVVQERYGAIALGTSASCCGPSDGAGGSCCGDDDCGSVALYDAETLASLPEEVTGVSLGCGNPVAIAGLQPGEVVLDLGSGGGIDCFLAARKVGESGHVIGVDMTPAMLARANENRERLGMQNVEFREGRIEALPVEDASVDVIMSNCVINLAPDKRPVFAEAFRVLKPGGRFSVSDIVTEGEFSEELRADKKRWAECVVGAIDGDQYAEMLREVGFVDVAIQAKSDAEGIVEWQPGMPRIFSALVVARKPS